MYKFLSIILALLLSACLSAQQGDTLRLKEISNLLYLDAEEVEVDSLQRLNLIIPEGVEKPPLLIWIGGGAWSYVNRHVEMDMAKRIAKAGIAVASIGHRQSAAIWRFPEQTKGVQHPAHAQDVAKACKWLYEQAATYGYDRDNLFIGGFSSGAHLASFLMMDRQYLAAEGIPASAFKGMIPIGGTYDVVDYHRAFAEGSRPHLADQHVKAVFGETEADFLAASPTHFLDSLQVPMLLMTDANTAHYTRLFEDRILEETEYRDFDAIYVHTLNHGDLWRNMSHEAESPYREMLIAFIHRHRTPLD